MKKKILIIAFKDFDKNLRGIKQINLLSKDFHIDYCGYNAYENSLGIRFIEIKPLFKKANLLQKIQIFIYLVLRLHTHAFRLMYDCTRLEKAIQSTHYDLIISHDLKPLHVLYANLPTQSRTKVFLDAHEYYKGIKNNFLNTLVFKPLNMFLYKKYIPRVNHIDTVNESIAGLYKEEFKTIPVTYTYNVPKYHEIKPRTVNHDSIKLIHHGYADPNRELERMIEVMRFTNKRFSLDLMLVSLTFEDTYIQKLQAISSQVKNVNIIPAVKQNTIMDTISKYDIGFYILPDTNPNMKYALPNKLFDFIQARLMVVTGPSIEMGKIVKKYDVGIVTKTFHPQDVAEKLNQLTPEDIIQYKKNSDTAAPELCAEEQLAQLKTVITQLVQ